MSKEYLEALAAFNYIMTRCEEEDSYIIEFPLGIQKGTTFGEAMEKAYQVIKQALLKQQELEKVLEIIKEKDVDIYILRKCKIVDEYNSKIVHIIGEIRELTQKELDLLKEVLGE